MLLYSLDTHCRHRGSAAKALPTTPLPIQFYSMGTPNGVKVTILLEEICLLDPTFDYSAHFVGLSGDQFNSGFVGVNPNR